MRRGEPGDFVGVARLLGAAFEGDGLAQWTHPAERVREWQLRRVFGASARGIRAAGDGVDVVSEATGRVVAGALWANPHRLPPRAGWLDRVNTRLAYGFRVRRAMKATTLIWQANVEEPHWHLLAVGTAEHARGRGYGAALVEYGLERCRNEGVAAHLETANAGDVPYFERFGFAVSGVLDLPGKGPRVWLMRSAAGTS